MPHSCSSSPVLRKRYKATFGVRVGSPVISVAPVFKRSLINGRGGLGGGGNFGVKEVVILRRLTRNVGGMGCPRKQTD